MDPQTSVSHTSGGQRPDYNTRYMHAEICNSYSRAEHPGSDLRIAAALTLFQRRGLPRRSQWRGRGSAPSPDSRCAQRSRWASVPEGSALRNLLQSGQTGRVSAAEKLGSNGGGGIPEMFFFAQTSGYFSSRFNSLQNTPAQSSTAL